MAKRSPSRQRRTERRAAERAAKKLERIERKMQNASDRLDPTKWLGQVRHPITGEIVNIPRIIPEAGSLWRCDLFDARFMVTEVRDNWVYGQQWSSSNRLNNIVERFSKSSFINYVVENHSGFTSKQEFLERLSIDVRRILNDGPPGPIRAKLIDFCGLDMMLEYSLQKIVEVLSDGGDYQGYLHFRPISQ